MKIRIICIFFSLLLLLFNASCENKYSADIITELPSQDPSLPDINNFSSEILLPISGQFPEVLCATLYQNGIPTELSKNNANLIRLLNFCANSVAEMSIGYSQGILKETDIPLNAPNRLEITFTGDIDESYLPLSFSGYDFAIISGREVFLRQSYQTYNPNKSNIWYSITPYYNTVIHEIEFDLLNYCGFSSTIRGRFHD